MDHRNIWSEQPFLVTILKHVDVSIYGQLGAFSTLSEVTVRWLKI